MSRTTEDIKVTKEKSSGGSIEYKEEHPAFGQISFSRRHGDCGKLYGSNLDKHELYITLSINKSILFHELSRDWFYSRDQIVEVDLSAAQFSELITTLNAGSGIPCTIRRVNKESIPEIPNNAQTEVERIEESFKEDMKNIVNKLKEYEDKVSEILEKKTLGKEDKKTIKYLLFAARKFFIDHAPFAIKSFVEAKEKVVTSAKIEVESFMMNVITRAGLEHLKSTKVISEQQVNLLESPKEEDA